MDGVVDEVCMVRQFVLLLAVLSALSGPPVGAQRPADSVLAADSATLLEHQAQRAYEHGSADSLRLAIQLWSRSLTFSRRAGHRAGEGTVLTWIGAAYTDLGRPDSALAYYSLALVILREVGDRRTEGTALAGLGTVCNALGRPDSGLASYRPALAKAIALSGGWTRRWRTTVGRW